MIYKIIVDKQSRTNPSSNRRTYIINIEELRFKGDIKDTLVINKEGCYIIRRLELSPYFILRELENPIKEPISNIAIELFEGENYIYIQDNLGMFMSAEYIFKNDFTDMYVTEAQMSAAIEISKNQVEISVNQILAGYSNTEEMNAIILAKANEINLEIAKKVGENEVISKINLSNERALISAR